MSDKTAGAEAVGPQFDEVVGSNIRQYRTARGLSQADLAQALSERIGERVHQQTVQKIEKGTRPLKYAEALAICQILDLVDLQDLSVGDEAAALVTKKLESLYAVGQLGLELHNVAQRLAEKLIDLARLPKSGTDIDGDVEIFLLSNWGLAVNSSLTEELLPFLIQESPAAELAQPTYLDILKAVSHEYGTDEDDDVPEA